MSSISYGYNRVSNSLQHFLASSSLMKNQSRLADYDTQIASGSRYQTPSGDALNASLTMLTQAVMERKAQYASNLKSANAYLTASDLALGGIGTLSNEARAAGLEAINTATGDAERETLMQGVKSSVQEIVDLANTNYLNRFLFAGTETGTEPFSWDPDTYALVFNGNPDALATLIDTNTLGMSNLSGAAVFGAISKPIASNVDFNPAVSLATPLAALNGGTGIDPGAIRMTFTDPAGAARSVEIDLARCKTLDDVRKAITHGAPAGAAVAIDLTENGLAISLAAETPGTLTIGEVGKGTVARELGINTAQPIDSGTTFRGRDLDPALTPYTPLDDLFGARAHCALKFEGPNNDIMLSARQNGAEVVDPETGEPVWPLNGIEVAFVSDAAIQPGSETVDFDAATNRLTVRVATSGTTANDVIAAINTASEEGRIPPLVASSDTLDRAVESGAAGTGTIDLLPDRTYDMGTTAYGSGEPFDKTSGIQVVNANKTHTIDFADCTTVSQMLAKLNDPRYGLYAGISADGTRLDISSRVSGTDFMIGENGGTTASQLGIRTLDGETRLDSFDYGRGVMDYEGPGTNASAVYTSQSANSSLRLTAKNEGDAWNNYELRFVETTDPDGKVTVAWDEENRTVTLGINPGITTACEVVTAFSEQPGPQEYFTLEVNTSDGPNTGNGVVYTGQASTSGGTAGGVDFSITRHDGVRLEIDIHGARTVNDILERINGASGNADGLLFARLNPHGNGIELIDSSVGEQTMRVDRSLLSTAAVDLGLIPQGEEFAVETTDATGTSLKGRDANPLETDSLFNALIRMQAAVGQNDARDVERATQLLDVSIDRLNASRSEIGIRQQGFDTMQTKLEEEYVQNRTTLLEHFEVDVAELSLDYTARQYAYQANLTVASRLFQLSLLNFI